MLGSSVFAHIAIGSAEADAPCSGMAFEDTGDESYMTSGKVTLGAGISALDQAAIEAPTEGSQESLVKAYLIALASELERALEPRDQGDSVTARLQRFDPQYLLVGVLKSAYSVPIAPEGAPKPRPVYRQEPAAYCNEEQDLDTTAVRKRTRARDRFSEPLSSLESKRKSSQAVQTQHEELDSSHRFEDDHEFEIATLLGPLWTQGHALLGDPQAPRT
ncbi:hypothetical protein JHW43_008387 [Diplocarpon mali]|nr:hypothetical protein JHW43_008387 [Diplocarpon mali]